MAHDDGRHPRLRPLEFGLHLRVLRVKAGLTQEQLAEVAGMHRTTIGRLERGQSGLSVQRLPELAAALKVEPRELIPERTGSMTRSVRDLVRHAGQAEDQSPGLCAIRSVDDA